MADTWIGVTDSRPIPLLNSLVASIESGYTPEDILVFVPQNDKDVLPTIRQLVENVCKEYNVDAEVKLSTTPSVNKPKDLSQHVLETLQEYEGTNAVSISSGSRLLNACLIGASNQMERFKLDHLYTLEGPNQANLESTIYPMIPRPEMDLIDYQKNSALELTGPGDHGNTDGVYKISRKQLPLLFNALYSTGNPVISVDHKSSILSTLYEIQLDRGTPASIRFTSDVNQYQEDRSEVGRRHGGQAESEIPDHRAFIGAFTSSVLEFDNQDEISDFIDPYRNRRLEHGNAESLAVFDTNLIQYWPAHQLGVAPEQEQGLNGYAVVTGVRDELMNYDGDEKINKTRQLEDAFGKEYRELRNQLKKTPRQLRLGRQYFSRLQRELYTEKIQSEMEDNNITAACEEVHQTGGFDLLLFSNDSGFISTARDRGLPSVLVDFPQTLPRKKDVTWEDASTALYLHAVQFGILKLPKIDLYGVWPRKRPEDWDTEKLAVRCRSPVVAKQLNRYQNILDASPGESQ
ncbi:hypothetical protein [Haloplanus aerogenes]|uniref:Uncharacterized protein n=1 Tax=Haloplanus aerogenes TaxID=660522 RepID=A0A3M0D9Y6_9EURY|nr:hypothetical protein [Haloplanus aerogenes]AZH26710.1 hypothetical protein DU502_15585 [Haloplanus aerogenes]RMB12953.1 hypothetical protein ATH50_3109 [Haloplanus aerogenes]